MHAEVITHKTVVKRATPMRRNSPYTPPKPKQKRKSVPNVYSNTIKMGQFEEMAKVLKVADERRDELEKLQSVVKELKREERSKDRIIDQLQKEIREGPEFLHSMSDELRVVKSERRNLQERMKVMEKNGLLTTEKMLRYIIIHIDA